MNRFTLITKQQILGKCLNNLKSRLTGLKINWSNNHGKSRIYFYIYCSDYNYS